MFINPNAHGGEFLLNPEILRFAWFALYLLDPDSFTVSSMYCDCNAVMPTAFTPNDDGLNDTYYPIFDQGCNITGYSFSIYNRWGQRVFYSQDPNAKWDGEFLGTRAELGVYMYYFKYMAGIQNNQHLIKGDITLIR